MAEIENGPKANEIPPCMGPYALTTSLSIGKIAEALSKAQGLMKPAEFDRENPAFKFRYATLASIWDAIRGPLSANGLAVTQIVSGMELVTMLLHPSGEFLRATMKLVPTQNTPQGFGSSLTYARRYCLSAIVGMAAADEDDDGNEASKSTPARAQVPAARPVPKPTAPKPEPKPGIDPAEVWDVDKAAPTGEPEEDPEAWRAELDEINALLEELNLPPKSLVALLRQYVKAEKIEDVPSAQAGYRRALLGGLRGIRDARAKAKE